MQRRRSVRQWIAGILKIEAHIEAKERKAIADKSFVSGYVLAIVHETGKPANTSIRDYAQQLAEQAGDAYVQFFTPPPQFATYEQPDKHTDAMRPVHPTAKLRPLTQSLPAVDPKTGYYKQGDHPQLLKRLQWEREQGKR